MAATVAPLEQLKIPEEVLQWESEAPNDSSDDEEVGSNGGAEEVPRVADPNP